MKGNQIIAVLGRVGNWHWADIERAAKTKNIQLSRCRFEDLAAAIDSDSVTISCGGFRLDQVNGMVIRAMPTGTLEEIVFRMDAVAALERLGIPVLNSAKTTEICVDKFATLTALRAAGVPIPPTSVCQNADEAVQAFEKFGHKAVLKPVFGSEGRGIAKIDSLQVARRIFELLARNGQTIYLQKFIDHQGWDLRILLVGDEAFAIRRSNKSDWRLNAARGADVERYSPAENEITLARLSAAAVNARICGVDLIYDRSGNPFVIELNASPGWRHVSAACGVDIAARVLELARS